ncbi:signal transducer, putative [Ectocarpus siliculosus]|uniref:Signal transducer, putative n=2 Tax=Ectocarpus siliculosus TaxID=2880 RepID=D7FU04_ECTSI|nr:signal transducer, putative [Ectocarpus siliculosus]|eukprot:CBJ31531.1 signal transducer, putative [Ectocarpus siliculosus]
MSDEEVWEPLTMVDYIMLGFVGTVQAFALGVCVHLLCWRNWPPYVTKNVDIVIIMTFGGFGWTIAGALDNGLIRRSEGDILAKCYLEIMLLSSISLTPALVALLVPGAYVFDETVNLCTTTNTSRTVTLAMNAVGFYTICYIWFVCTRQLKWVRKQFNEYETMKWTLSCLTLLLFSYAVVVVVVLDGQHVYVRRVAIVYPALTTHTVLWGSIGRPVLKKWTRDDEYLWSFTKGFSEMPSPAQLKASLAEQLSVEQLRTEFRRYIETRVAQELVNFYLDSLDREEIKEYFARQAVTMRIVAQYIKEGAPEEVNISGECREEILSTDVTAYDIFDRARVEVLTVMETNFQREFVETEGFRRIADASELEQRENRLLRAGGFLPPDTPPSPSV